MVIFGSVFPKITVVGLGSLKSIIHQPKARIRISLLHAADLDILTHLFTLPKRINQNRYLPIPGITILGISWVL